MINYRILPEQKLIAICNWEETSVNEIEMFSLNLRNDPHFSQSFDTIIDNTKLKQIYSIDEINILSEPRIDINISAGRVAVLTASDITFGISRMHGILSENQSPHNINIFRDIGSALKWLEREDLDIESIFEEIKKEIK